MKPFVCRRCGACCRTKDGIVRVGEAEIARMLSGSVTDTSLAHARELLTSV